MKVCRALPPTEADPEFPPLRTTQTAWKQDASSILALLITAFAVRFYSLQFFHVISTDGTSYALTARAFAHGDLHGLAVSGFYPVLIAVAHHFISDLETAGRIVSVILGSLLVLPVYLLGKDIFSRKIAIATCMLVVVWPSFVSSSCEVMTQATHTTLQLSSIYLFWRAFKKPTLLHGGLAGLLIGLTYLTRPESLLLFVTMPLALLILNHHELRKHVPMAATYCGSFLILFLANMLLVHHSTGQWQLSAKTDSALNDALSYYLNRPDLNYIPGYKPKGYLDILRDYPGFIWHNIAKNLKDLWGTMFSPSLWILFTLGFFSGGFDREKNNTRLLLLATVAPVAVLVVFYYISSGYIQAYQPFMFVFAAAGFSAAEEQLKKQFLSQQKFSMLQRVPLLVTAAAIYAAVTFFPQIRSNITDIEYLPETDNFRRDEKHIGLLLKDSLPPGKIMTRWARVAFYAEREWINIPAGTSRAAIVKLARESGVRFFIADGTLYMNRPMLGEELFKLLYDGQIPFGRYYQSDKEYTIQGLKPFMVYTDPKSMGVVVYEIEPEANAAE